MAQPTVEDCRVTGFILPAQIGNHAITVGSFRGEPTTYLIPVGDPHDELMDDSTSTLRQYQSVLDVIGGDVLLIGLGLGCLVHGLLQSGAASSVDVIEVEPDVVDLVAPYFPEPEVNIILADALTYDDWPDGKTWDTAFFDCFPQDPQLAKRYAVLEERYAARTRFLGSWAWPKYPDGNLMIERSVA